MKQKNRIGKRMFKDIDITTMQDQQAENEHLNRLSGGDALQSTKDNLKQHLTNILGFISNFPTSFS